jgi:hypothetical protein
MMVVNQHNNVSANIMAALRVYASVLPLIIIMHSFIHSFLYVCMCVCYADYSPQSNINAAGHERPSGDMARHTESGKEGVKVRQQTL